MSNTILIDASLNEQFQRKGYVLLPLLDATELKHIRTAFDRLKPDDNFKPSGNRYHCTFLDANRKYKADSRSIFERLLLPKIQSLLADYELLVGNFYVKNPGGSGEFPVHQNWDTVDEATYTSVTAWIPLQDTVRRNGTIEVVEGSHRLSSNIASRNVDYYFKPFADRIKTHYCRPCEMSAGEVLIFDDDLIHYSRANEDDQTRVAIQLSLVPRQAQPLIYHFDPGAPHRGFEVFAAKPEFFLVNNDCQFRPRGLKSLGHIPNNNTFLTEEEFSERLNNGDELRKAFYSQLGQSRFSRDKCSNFERSVASAGINLARRVFKI